MARSSIVKADSPEKEILESLIQDVARGGGGHAFIRKVSLCCYYPERMTPGVLKALLKVRRASNRLDTVFDGRQLLICRILKAVPQAIFDKLALVA